MKFRNIRAEYGDYFSEYHILHSGLVDGGRKRTDEERTRFTVKWRSGKATIGDWVYANPEEVKLAEEGLSAEQLMLVNEHRKKLYDLWLEIRVQDVFASKLKEVIQYAPSSIETFCKEELQRLEQAVTELQPGQQKLGYLQEKRLQHVQSFPKIFAEVTDGDYKSAEDVHAPKVILEAEALARYKKYLENFIVQGLEQEPFPALDPNEISLESLWPELLHFAKELTVEYHSDIRHYKEDSYVSYEVERVSGCSVWSLRKRMDQMFDKGFNTLLDKLSSLHKDDQVDVIEGLIDQIKELTSFTTDGKYVEEESEYGPRKEHRFKKFKSLRYKGDRDLRFAHNKESRAYMDQNLVGYVETWVEGIQAMERKLEHLVNNLTLVNKLSVTFDITGIFENVFIIESAEIARQGTAFYLQDIGIITSDHCLRDEYGKLCGDAVIYKHDKISDPVAVKVIKSDQAYDLAILEVENGQSGFLGTGLQIGSSDELEITDAIGVAGFPNYNYGDSGNFTTGSVSMFRTISGIRHILVTNPLVEGNSGGPGFNRLGQVVGVVTFGTSTFSKALSTEKHGLTPIELIELLIGK